MATASSPAASALPPGVFSTRILRSEAAFTSMLSTPAPALPMTLSDLPARNDVPRRLRGGAHHEPARVRRSPRRACRGRARFSRRARARETSPNSAIPSFDKRVGNEHLHLFHDTRIDRRAYFCKSASNMNRGGARRGWQRCERNFSMMRPCRPGHGDFPRADPYRIASPRYPPGLSRIRAATAWTRTS